MTTARMGDPPHFTGAMEQGINIPYPKPLSITRTSAEKGGDREQYARRGIVLLCEHFGISIDEPGAIGALAYCLMAKHVPYFSSPAGVRHRGPKGMSVSETCIFFVEACHVGIELCRDLGRAPSKSEISAKLMPALRRHEQFQNKKKFGLATVRKLLGQIDTAKRDYRAGKANNFQRILIEDVRDVLARR